MTHSHTQEELETLDKLASVAEEVNDMAEQVIDSAESCPVPEKPEVQVVKLDTEDALRLENMMLRNKVAKMSVTLAEKQAKENQEAFQNHLIAKFRIDTRTHQLQVNPTDHTVAIVPR